jgi:hypothetical protein
LAEYTPKIFRVFKQDRQTIEKVTSPVKSAFQRLDEPIAGKSGGVPASKEWTSCIGWPGGQMQADI